METLIVTCDPTIKTDNVFNFLHQHLDCDCIVDKTNEISKNEVEIIAYAKNENGNIELEEYYKKKNFKPPIFIFQGISHMEVDCIDSI